MIIGKTRLIQLTFHYFSSYLKIPKQNVNSMIRPTVQSFLLCEENVKGTANL